MLKNKAKIELKCLFILFAVLSVNLLLFSLYTIISGNYQNTNIAINLAFLILPLACIYFLTSKQVLILLTPFGWFLISTSIFYGFGPLLYSFGNEGTIEYTNYTYEINQAELYRVNMLVSVNILVILATYVLSLAFFKYPGRDGIWNQLYLSLKERHINILISTSRFLMLLGIPIHFFLIVPQAIGMTNWVIPGVIQYIGVAIYGALITLYLLKDKFFIAKLQFYFILISLVITGLISLSKTLLFLGPITIGIAFILKGAQIRRLVTLGGVAFLVFMFISPIIMFARILNDDTSSFQLEASMLGDIVNTVSDNSITDNVNALSGTQFWWTRLNYASQQSFAISEYDKGNSGKSLSDVVWIIVPRAIYPDKPMLSKIGNEFNESFDGNYSSAASPTFIIEGYWNFGWIGLILCGLFLGLMFYCWRIYCDWLFSNFKFQYLPIWFSGLLMGIFQDGWLIINCLGVLIIIFITHYFIKVSFQIYKEIYSIIRN